MPSFNERLRALPREQRHYTLSYLAMELVEARQSELLLRLLTTFEFLHAKVVELEPQLLIDDFDLAFVLGLADHEDGLRLIQAALRLSAHVLIEDPAQLAGQLIGRLVSFPAPEVQDLLAQAGQWKSAPWLRPLSPILTPPGGSLQRILIGHTASVSDVAITPDGRRAVSASHDRTLKVWDLDRGVEERTLAGHTKDVYAVALSTDGSTLR